MKLLEKPLAGEEQHSAALRALAALHYPRLIETLINIEVTKDGPLFDTVVSLAESLGVSALPVLTRHLHDYQWAWGRRVARDEECARALLRIGKPECEAALEAALLEAEELLRVKLTVVFTEQLVNALEVFRDPEHAAKREKHESENNKLISIIQDNFEEKGARVAAIRKLVASGDSRVVRVLARVFRMQDYEGRVEDASFAELERIGLDAIPALAYALYFGDGTVQTKAAPALARLGGTTCEAILKASLAKCTVMQKKYGWSDGSCKFLKDTLQKLREPETVRLREERDAIADAPYRKELCTEDPVEAARLVFEDMIPQVPELTSGEISRHFADWSGPSAEVPLKRGSVEASIDLVRTHFQSLKQRNGFDLYRIKLDRRWRCVFVTTFYGGLANFLLVWRSSDGCAVAHT